MNNIKLYYHGGSKNHGCEAIVRSTKKILNVDLELYTTAKEEDFFYGLDKLVSIKSDIDKYLKTRSLRYFLSALEIKIREKTILNTKYRRQKLLNQINKNDICLSIGGDNYCYAGVETLSNLNYLMKKKGAKTVLWGCSIEPRILDDDIVKDLKRYDLITVRESLTKQGLYDKGIIDNVMLFSDPAFQLDKIELDLPEGFIENNTVGINISPLIINSEKKKGIALKNYSELINYIINNTDMQIALIPHVVKEDSDDRKPLKKLYDLFKDTQRVILLSDYNCMELKGFISRCRFFIGARTHATIAAYSTNIPTLVIGYSIKAKGIAKDIFGTYQNYVLPVQSLKNKDDLTKAFQWLVINELEIKKHLHDVMPTYKQKSMAAGEIIRSMMK